MIRTVRFVFGHKVRLAPLYSLLTRLTIWQGVVLHSADGHLELSSQAHPKAMDVLAGMKGHCWPTKADLEAMKPTTAHS